MTTSRLHLVRCKVGEACETETRRVLAALQRPRLARAVARVMRASEIDLIATAQPVSVSRWLEETPIDLIISDQQMLAAVLDNCGGEFGATPLMVLCEELGPTEWAGFVEISKVSNLVANLGEIDHAELLVTTRKVLEQDIFGVEKYLRWGSAIRTSRVNASRERHVALGALESFLSELQCTERQTSQLVTIADELVMNGLYDAPIDRDGTHPYHHRNRREPVTLPEADATVLQFGSDGRNVAVGCRDPFGTLTPDRIRTVLSRCLRKGNDQVSFTPGGAGVGLYIVFNFVDQLIINIAPGRATEVIGIVDIAARPRQRSRSFHIFTASEG